MKYQVYLNKATTEAINAIAQDAKMTPNHYLKVLIEGMVQKAKAFIQESLPDIDIEEAIKDGNIQETKTGSKH